MQIIQDIIADFLLFLKENPWFLKIKKYTVLINNNKERGDETWLHINLEYYRIIEKSIFLNTYKKIMVPKEF